MTNISPTKLFRLRYEKFNLKSSIEQLEKLHGSVTDTKYRKDIRNHLNSLKIRLDEFYRIVSILHIKI